MENTEQPKRPGFLKRLFRRLNRDASPKSQQKTAPEPGQDTESEWKKPVYISDAFQKVNWDLSANPSIVPFLGEVGEVFQKHGFFDGARGVNGTRYFALAKTKVQGLADDLRAILVGEQKQLQTQITGLKTIAKCADDDFKELNRVVLRKRYHPRHFSLLLAVIYLVVALLLVLADIPLAVKLIQEGFNFPYPDPPMSELMKQPIQVLAANWETVLMALGISLSSIFFKILYDEFVGGPLSRKATVTKREPEIDPSKPEDTRRLMRSYHFRATVKFIIFSLTLGTIIVLGVFRFQAMKISGEYLPEMVNGVTMSAFILITLLFPIVSGVCFSMGLDRWLNWQELKLVQLRMGPGRKRFIQTQERLVETTASLEKISEVIEWVKSNTFFNNTREFLLACYAIGYERGQMTPDSVLNDKGYFEMVSRMRRKIVSRQVFNSIHQANESNGETISEQFARMYQDEIHAHQNGNHEEK